LGILCIGLEAVLFIRCIKDEEGYSSTSAAESSEDEEDEASMRDEDVDQN